MNAEPTIKKRIRAAVKSVIPDTVLKWRQRERDLRYFREHYFEAKLRLIRPLVVQTGETHNFTYDLTDRNLRYLGEMIAIATRRRAVVDDP